MTIERALSSTVLFGQSLITHTPSYNVMIKFSNGDRDWSVFQRYYLCDTPKDARSYAIKIKKGYLEALRALRDIVNSYGERFLLRNVYYDVAQDAFRYTGRYHNYSSPIKGVK